MMGAQLLMLSMTFVDNMMVGRLGRDTLAGLAIAGGFYSFAQVIMIGVLGAVSPLASQAYGKESFERVGFIARQGFIFTLILSLILAIGLHWAEDLLLLMGQQTDLVPIAGNYLKAMIWAVPFQLSYTMLRQISEATGASMQSMTIGLLAAMLNIPLDYVLIYGKFGFPALGVAGAGYATAAVSALMCFTLVIHMTRHRHFHVLKIWQGGFRPHLPTLLDIVKVGIPLGSAVGAEMTFFVGSTFLMGTIGANELAAHQIALNAASIVFMIPLGLSFAISVRMGQFVGKGDMQAARTVWLAGLVIVTATQSVTALLFLLTPDFIIALYGQTADVALLGRDLLFIAALFQLFDGLQVVGMGALRGLKQGTYAFFAAFSAFWVGGAAVVWWFYVQSPPSPVGIWLGLLTGLLLAAIMHHGRILYISKASRESI